jgi:hypothetical protein
MKMVIIRKKKKKLKKSQKERTKENGIHKQDQKPKDKKT